MSEDIVEVPVRGPPSDDCQMNHRKASPFLSRRSFAQSLSLATGLTWLGTSRPALAAPQAKVHDLRIISKSADPHYCGWPTLTRRRGGQLLVVWSGGRQSHVCPFGRVEMMRSDDQGETWTWPRVLLDSPIQLADGRLLYAGEEWWTDQKRIGICQSIDDGQSWQWLAEIPTRDNDDRKAYHELYAVEADSGRLIVHIRNHNPQDAREILQSESDDGGKTWSMPHAIGVWGLPSCLNKLRDGRLLSTHLSLPSRGRVLSTLPTGVDTNARRESEKFDAERFVFACFSYSLVYGEFGLGPMQYRWLSVRM